MPEQWQSAAFDLEVEKKSISLCCHGRFYPVAYLLKAGYPFRQLEFHNPKVMLYL